MGITNSYYRGAQAVGIVFDVTNRESFEHVTAWQQGVIKCGTRGVRMQLIGTKCDLSSARVVAYEEALALANSLGMPYVETSAKDAHNVQEAFLSLCRVGLGRHVQASPTILLTVTGEVYQGIIRLTCINIGGQEV